MTISLDMKLAMCGEMGGTPYSTFAKRASTTKSRTSIAILIILFWFFFFCMSCSYLAIWIDVVLGFFSWLLGFLVVVFSSFFSPIMENVSPLGVISSLNHYALSFLLQLDPFCKSPIGPDTFAAKNNPFFILLVFVLRKKNI